ncbi:hypothetical protein CA11_19620 [Gimesia maris]|nr:hypothetical protein CA11_19620 [Gimesia maris]
MQIQNNNIWPLGEHVRLTGFTEKVTVFQISITKNALKSTAIQVCILPRETNKITLSNH